MAGDDIEFAAPHVTSLALLFHEFTTNAAKYGALQTEEGFIEISTRPPCGLNGAARPSNHPPCRVGLAASSKLPLKPA